MGLNRSLRLRSTLGSVRPAVTQINFEERRTYVLWALGSGKRRTHPEGGVYRKKKKQLPDGPSWGTYRVKGEARRERGTCRCLQGVPKKQTKGKREGEGAITSQERFQRKGGTMSFVLGGSR